MFVRIKAYVPPEDEDEFMQAIEDADFAWMQEINPKWVEAETLEDEE